MTVAVHVLDITTGQSQYHVWGTYDQVLPAHDAETTRSSQVRYRLGKVVNRARCECVTSLQPPPETIPLWGTRDPHGEKARGFVKSRQRNSSGPGATAFIRERPVDACRSGLPVVLFIKQIPLVICVNTCVILSTKQIKMYGPCIDYSTGCSNALYSLHSITVFCGGGQRCLPAITPFLAKCYCDISIGDGFFRLDSG